jgi:hypothetical protein
MFFFRYATVFTVKRIDGRGMGDGVGRKSVKTMGHLKRFVVNK